MRISGPPWVVDIDPPVSGAGNAARTIATIGDSFAAREFLTNQIASATVSGGVMTVTTSATHGMQYTGQRVSISGFAVAGANVFNTPATLVSTTVFSVPVTGVPDGALAIGSLTPFASMLGLPRDCSAARQFCRRSAKYVSGPNLGRSGHTTAELVAVGVAGRLSGRYAAIVVDISGANSLSRYSALSDAEWLAGEQAAYAALVAMVQPYAPYVHIIGPAAFTSSYSGASAGNIARINALNRWLYGWCATNGYGFTDRLAITVDTTGYALAGYTIVGDNLHATAKQASAVGARMVSDWAPQLGRKRVHSSVSDTYSVSTTSKNLMPAFGYGTAGAGGTGMTGTFVTNASVVRGTGTATAVGSAVARTDGPGNLQRLVITGAASDSVRIRVDGNTTAALALANAGTPLTLRWLQSVSGAAGVLRGVYGLLTVTVDGVTDLLYLNTPTSFANVNEVGLDESLSLEDVREIYLRPGAACTLVRFEIYVEFASAGQGGSGGTVTFDFGCLETDY